MPGIFERVRQILVLFDDATLALNVRVVNSDVFCKFS